VPTKLRFAVCTWFALFAVPSLRAQSVRDTCPVVEADSARFGAQPVYRACAVSRVARRQKLVEPEFVAEMGLTCAVAKLELLVDAEGRPHPASARVLETNSKAFAAALIESTGRWRFKPAERDAQKVAQLVVLEHAMRVKDPLGRIYSTPRTGADARSGLHDSACGP
jgi:hypothetical protein